MKDVYPQVDAGIPGQQPHVGFDGIEKAIAKTWSLALVEDPAVAEILLGALKEPDVHAVQPTTRVRRYSCGEDCV